MELEGDSPAPRPLVSPESLSSRDFHVTPENVVVLAALFRKCTDILAPMTRNVEYALRLEESWMRDPVSIWARLQFNQYFVDGPHALATIVVAEYNQHKAMTAALVSTAKQYGLTEELAAAGFAVEGYR